MKRSFPTALAIVAGLLLAGTAAPSSAADADIMTINSVSEIRGEVLHLPLNKSIVIDLPEEVRDVLVSNPAIADAVLRSNKKIYLIGASVGETNVFLFGAENREIARFEVVVSRDTIGVDALIREVVPGSAIKVQTIGDSMVLSGTVPTPEGATKAAEVAAKFIGDPSKVVNMMTVAGSDQVNLRVVIAEVQRTAAKQIGVDFNISASVGGVSFNPITNNLFGVAGSAVNNTRTLLSGGDFSATIRALERDGILRSLAEPNLTAVSGDDANFLVGGEVPAVSAVENGVATYTYKPYGVGLGFTPVVLSPGRISLRIKTEISELDPTTSQSVFVGFKTRRAETTVELPSGGSIAIGGLIKDDVRQSFDGVPGLMNVPILGTLFKSRDFQRSQTELVIFVTPYIVDPVATSALTRPDKNFEAPNDAQGIFLGQVNRVYRTSPSAPGATPYYGRYGFVYE